MERPSENLLSRLEQSLRQSRAARMHLAARLRELEAEADSVRAELAEMDNLLQAFVVRSGLEQSYSGWPTLRCGA